LTPVDRELVIGLYRARFPLQSGMQISPMPSAMAKRKRRLIAVSTLIDLSVSVPLHENQCRYGNDYGISRIASKAF